MPGFTYRLTFLFKPVKWLTLSSGYPDNDWYLMKCMYYTKVAKSLKSKFFPTLRLFQNTALITTMTNFKD